MNTFYNTTKEPEVNRHLFEVKSISQQQQVLFFLKKHPGKWFTPYALLNELNLHFTAIHSIKRSLTNLTKMGKACKSQHTVLEKTSGRPTHQWTINFKTALTK